MKKALSNCLKGLIVILAIAAFCMMFSNQIKFVFTASAVGITSKTETLYKFNEVFFGTDVIKGAPLGFVGYILILVGGLLTFFSVFFNKKKQHGYVLCLVTLGFLCLVVGTVFVSLIKTTFESANGGTTSGKYLNAEYNWLVGPIIAIIAGAIASLLNLIVLLFDLKKSKK